MQATTSKEHTKDSDCSVDAQTGLCAGCGVLHGSPCVDCGGSGFHAEGCEIGLASS